MIKSETSYSRTSIREFKTLMACLSICLLAIFSDNALADRLMTGGSTSSTDNIISLEDNPVNNAISEINNGNYEEAIGTLMSLAISTPQNPEVFNQLGYAHSRLQNYDLAMEFYLEALKIHPEHAGALAYKAKVHLEFGEIGIAEEHLRQLDLICLFGCEAFSTLQEAISLYYANEGE